MNWALCEKKTYPERKQNVIKQSNCETLRGKRERRRKDRESREDKEGESSQCFECKRSEQN